MADLEDVSATLVSMIAGFLTGPGGVPVNGVQTDVFPGWPKPDDLNKALAAGGVQVSVYPMPGAATQVSRHQRDWQPLKASTITTTAAIVGRTITFAGTITLPCNVSVRAGNAGAAYSAVQGDTLVSLAAGITAALIAKGVNAEASGSSVTVPMGGDLTVSIGGMGTLARENARDRQTYQIIIWAPTQALRKATAEAFEPQLMGINILNLPDGTQGNLMYMKSMINDFSEVENMYRRDLWFTVEFPYIETTPGWNVVTVSVTTEKE